MEFKEFIFVHVSSNISHMGHSVSPDETPRREYDAQRSIFDELRGVSSVMKHCVACSILLLKQNNFRRRN